MVQLGDLYQDEMCVHLGISLIILGANQRVKGMIVFIRVLSKTEDWKVLKCPLIDDVLRIIG